MSRLSEQNLAKARATIALYPHPRSALIPLCHLVQSQDGYLTEDGIEHVAELVGVTPAEVRGTASFYDMFHLEPVGRYVLALCTNIACMLSGAFELLEHAEVRLGIGVGQTTTDGMFTLEEAECLAGCDAAPCVQVNHRFFGPVTPGEFDGLLADLSSGSLDATVPHHGVLNRVERAVGLVTKEEGSSR
jgi:NADH-quinone oxidoreductase E subunit